MRLTQIFLCLGLLLGPLAGLAPRALAENETPPVAPADGLTPATPTDVPAAATDPAPTADPAGEADTMGTEVPPTEDADAPATPPTALEDMRRGLEDGLKSGRPGDIVRVGGDILVAAEDIVGEVVAVFGSIIAEGKVNGDAVAVMGDVTLNGGSRGDVVAVLGNVIINGPTRGDVVAVLGSVQLGPEAEIRGDIVSVGGRIKRAPGATISGEQVQLPFLPGDGFKFDGLRAWVQQCLIYGRPLAIGENLGWVWVLTLSFFAFYLLLTLLFGRAMSRTAEALEQAPGMTVLTAVLTLLLTPVLLVLLAFTGIGPLLFIPLLMVASLFGKAAMLTWIGRRVTGERGRALPVLATFAGGVILIALYLVPYVGFAAQKLASFLGLGMAVYAALIAMRREGPPATPAVGTPLAATAATPLAGSVDSAMPLRSDTPPPLPVPPVPPVPPSPASAPATSTPVSLLPRAGFWIRSGALFLDALLVAILTKLLALNGFYLVLFATYCTVLWALKGSTIGGMICGLKVARLDDRPVDWPVALVRALAGFVSLVPLGLGFFWIAFDRDRQSWHDKIAGTIVVRPPKGVSLI